MSQPETQEQQDETKRLTEINCWIDEEGGGHFHVKVDPMHFPGAVGGLFACLMDELTPVFALRGMSQQEMAQRFQAGYTAMVQQRAQDHPLVSTDGKPLTH